MVLLGLLSPTMSCAARTQVFVEEKQGADLARGGRHPFRACSHL